MGLATQATEEITDQIEAVVPGAFAGASPAINTAIRAVNV
jgi:hypothetical protein